MQLSVYRSLWGLPLPLDEALRVIKSEGYAGVEGPLPSEAEAGRFRDLLCEHGLSFIVGIKTEGCGPREHLASFRRQLEASREFAAERVRSHSGRDAWSRSEAVGFFRDILAVEADLGVSVCHETHRGRILYNPWITRDLVEEFDRLRLCADYSHWVCVCERLLEDEEPILRLCAPRVTHIHARVGYTQGPQVPDPAAPEWRAEMEAHERWWDWVWDAQTARGDAVCTLTPEFGPPPYLQTLPRTNAPVADLGEVCLWMAERQRRRFAERASRGQ